MRRKRVVFLAAHLLSPTVASGGDILFCEIANRLRRLHPEWEIMAVAPDFCKEALSAYFERVDTFATPASDGRQGGPANVAATWAGRLARVTRTLRNLDPDLIHTTGDFFVDVLPSLWVRRTTGCRWTGVVHHVNAAPHKRRNSLAVATVSFALQRGSFAALKNADAILLLNEGVRSELRALGFRADRLNVVGAGIDIDKFPLVRPPDKRTRVAWLNRLEPTKGIFDLPQIAARLPDDVVMDVIGSGPQVFVDRLASELRQRKLESKCVLRGFLPHPDLLEALAAASVFISCSYEEGFGISIAEALASGIPCITYDLPSHREIFGDRIARVPLGDTESFARAIESALRAGDTPETRLLRRESVAELSFDSCARRQEAVFERLMVTMPARAERV